MFVAAAFAEPEADPSADPYLLYGGSYGYPYNYGSYGHYYNGLHPVYKTIVPATVEKTEKAADPETKTVTYPLHYPYGRLHYGAGYPGYTYGRHAYPYTYGSYGYGYPTYPFTAFAPAAAEKAAEPAEKVKREADADADADAFYGYGYGHGLYGSYGYSGYNPYGVYSYGHRYPYTTYKYVKAEEKSDETAEVVKKVVPFGHYYYPRHFGYNYGRYYY